MMDLLLGIQVSTITRHNHALAADRKKPLPLKSVVGSFLNDSSLAVIEAKTQNVKRINFAEKFDKKMMLEVTQVKNVNPIKYKVKFDFEAV